MNYILITISIVGSWLLWAALGKSKCIYRSKTTVYPLFLTVFLVGITLLLTVLSIKIQVWALLTSLAVVMLWHVMYMVEPKQFKSVSETCLRVVHSGVMHLVIYVPVWLTCIFILKK